MRPNKSVVVAILLSIFVIEYSTFVVDSLVWDRIIKLGVFFSLAAFFKNYSLSGPSRITLALYGALLSSALLASLIQMDADGITQFMKFLLAFMVLPLALKRLPNKRDPPGIVLKLPIFWACLFSVQSVILFTLIYFEYPVRSVMLRLERLPFYDTRSFGIWGYGNALWEITNGSQILRVSSWFHEPAKLAAFLMYPIFVAWGYYVSTRNIRYLVQAGLCLACLAATFSLAGMFGFLGACLSLAMLRPAPDRRPRVTLRVGVKLVAIAGLFLLLAQVTLSKLHNLYEYHDETVMMKALARDPTSQTLVRDSAMVDTTMAIIGAKPFGAGLADTGSTEGADTTSSNGFMWWVKAGGIPAAIILVLLYVRLTYVYCIPLLLFPRPVYRGVAAGFIGATIVQLSDGTFVTPYYLLNIGIMMLCADSLRRLSQQEPSLELAALSHRTRSSHPGA